VKQGLIQGELPPVVAGAGRGEAIQQADRCIQQ
jgi:hypothetical protein